MIITVVTIIIEKILISRKKIATTAWITIIWKLAHVSGPTFESVYTTNTQLLSQFTPPTHNCWVNLHHQRAITSPSYWVSLHHQLAIAKTSPNFWVSLHHHQAITSPIVESVYTTNTQSHRPTIESLYTINTQSNHSTIAHNSPFPVTYHHLYVYKQHHCWKVQKQYIKSGAGRWGGGGGGGDSFSTLSA